MPFQLQLGLQGGEPVEEDGTIKAPSSSTSLQAYAIGNSRDCNVSLFFHYGVSYPSHKQVKVVQFLTFCGKHYILISWSYHWLWKITSLSVSLSFLWLSYFWISILLLFMTPYWTFLGHYIKSIYGKHSKPLLSPSEIHNGNNGVLSGILNKITSNVEFKNDKGLGKVH